MLDATGERAVGLVESVLSGGGFAPTSEVAREVVEVLQREGLIARCSCPHGWGQVRDDGCAVHGSRTPAHTVVGASGRA